MKKLLVIRLGALGDLIHVSPSLVAIKAAQPDLEIHLLTSPAYESLLGYFPTVDRVWTWNKRTGWRGLWQLAKVLREAGIDGVVNLHPSFKSWLLTRLLQPAGEAVYHKEKLRIKGQAQRPLTRRHAVEDFYEPFRRLLALPSLNDKTPQLRLLEGTSLPKPAGEQWIGMIPGVGGKRGNRAWLAESYQQLIAALLRQPETRILLIGGPDEQVLAKQLVASVMDPSGRMENHCGRHDIPGTMRLLAQCDLVIGGDTGPMHMAAALGRPLVGIYGPTSLARTGAIGWTGSRMLTPPDALACWPCEQPICPLQGTEHLRCMREIPVETVLATSWELLGKS